MNYEEEYRQDIKQYLSVIKRYAHIQENDIVGAYALMKEAHVVAERWSKIKHDIKSTSKRGENAALKERVEEMYRYLKEIATTCRVIWKLAKESYNREEN